MKKIILIMICTLLLAVGIGYFGATAAKRFLNIDNSDTEEISTETINEASNNAANAEAASLPYDLGDGVTITAIDSYTGDFVEDGSDEYVEDILMIKIENTGDNSYQLLNVTLNEQYHFQVTTLLPGMTMMVLESDRAAYDPDMVLNTVEASDVAVFTEDLSFYDDMYKIEGSDGGLTITNLTDQASPVGKVFFKNKISSGYLGGITYCVSFPVLEAGESTTIPTGHYSADNSELLFVTHGE